jgi:hypothetical protein
MEFDMVDRVEIELDDEVLHFDLDHEKRSWQPVGAVGTLDEPDFPLIATNGGKRYELYSDGTFAEVEL